MAEVLPAEAAQTAAPTIALPTEVPAEETLLDVVLARFADFRAHRCSRLTLAATLHAASGAKPNELAEFLLHFLETQSKRVDVKVEFPFVVFRIKLAHVARSPRPF